MPPKSSTTKSSAAKTQKKPKATLKVNPLRTNASEGSYTRINPLTAFTNLPSSNGNTATQPSQEPSRKGKEKATETPSSTQRTSVLSDDAPSDQLWVDMYEPTTEEDLAVHKRKVDDVRGWLLAAFEGPANVRKYRRILVLNGPAGTGKTTTIKVLARELGYDIMEWRNSVNESSSSAFTNDSDSAYASSSSGGYAGSEALFTKFEAFITRASSCNNLFTQKSSKPLPSPSTQTSSSSTPVPTRRLILLEDLPNIMHQGTREQFHALLEGLVMSPQQAAVPVVIVISDAGLRGEASDERLASGVWKRDDDRILDVRTVLSKDLLHGPFVTQIRFNPIAPTFLTKALQSLLSTHFSSTGKKPSTSAPTKEFLEVIVDSANGDIRSAVMALQFACVVDVRGKASRKKGSGTTSSKDAMRAVLASVTRREQSLELFHLIGKVMYNKRKGDAPGQSALARDIRREQELDKRLKDPPLLPSFLAHHNRKASRVDVDGIYSDSPIDSSLFSLYIHQNYTQFCNEMDHCDGVADWLSWTDSSGGEMWYQANPHQFHLLTLGTLHSLPQPVTRRGQKTFKPEFFDYLAKEKEAWDSVRDTRSWLVDEGIGLDTDSGWRTGGWSSLEVATEIGGVLRAREAHNDQNSQSGASQHQKRAPHTHRLFSHLPFSKGSGSGQTLGENEDGEVDAALASHLALDEDHAGGSGIHTSWDREKEEEQTKTGWLEEDDIEDFE